MQNGLEPRCDDRKVYHSINRGVKQKFTKVKNKRIIAEIDKYLA